ncbi:MAG: branched-chain amino acid ABC transporter permease [Haloarculaceae archaeon]
MVAADIVVSLVVLATFYALLALGMNIKYGHTGLLDFGHVGFYLIGAYTAALLVIPKNVGGPDTVYILGLHLPWVVGVLVAVVLSGVVGAFVALPTLRLREDYLAITVLGVSVIFQRVVQAESWLANGPDALRGITPPLITQFPVDGHSYVGVVIIGLIGGMVWALTTLGLGRIRLILARAERSVVGGATDRLYAIGLLGTDRILRSGSADNTTSEIADEAAVAGFEDTSYVRASFLAGAIVAVVTAVVVIVNTKIGLLAMGTIISLYTWLVLLAAINSYANFDAVDYLATLALGTGYMLALAPMYYIDSYVVWIPLTLVAFAVVIGVTTYLERNWSRFANRPFRYGLFTGVWFGFIWLFPIQILTSVLNADFMDAATTVFNNLVWMLSFAGETPRVGYSRFMLFLFGAIVLVSLFVMELIVDSPFGRVLRAVRNDERVVNSLGKDPFLYKIQSMALGSALGGLAGALAAMYYQVLVFTMFAPRVTFIALLIMFLGGVGNNRAMIVGAFLFWAFQMTTTELSGFVAPGIRENFQALRFVLMGVLFLVILYYRPQGLMGRQSSTGVSES